MTHLLKKIDDAMARVEEVTVVVVFLILVAIVVGNILARNVFGASFQVVLQFAPVCVVWLALFGTTLALKRQRHIKMEILLRYCSPRFRRSARILVSLFGLAVMGILFFAAIRFFESEVDIFGTKGWLALIYPIFFAVAAFRYACRMFLPDVADRPGSVAEAP